MHLCANRPLTCLRPVISGEMKKKACQILMLKVISLLANEGILTGLNT